ncbi:pre-mRNA cleavage complex 2 protein Pcf11 isoform X2 [Austrofundulus limnaeus]|uniref:Pre-mRNA cleavage complex 2 protein Pcf11 n=1 Tax=Austrofundulus limnaeus TaxID=52670 RepID=A0A2I4D1B3_AUSLI|nr:PREDICTED: pre-mRNA cleavage complex 2 protein Pcf11-like isoform X2 [Austrofundulus limnaeus]
MKERDGEERPTAAEINPRPACSVTESCPNGSPDELMDCLLIRGSGVHQAAAGVPGSLVSKMEDAAAKEDACREYQSSLEDLTFNSKPHINMLTILAEENTQFAKDIVAIIEAQISKAPANEKLPVLYLVDSIVKNVGGEYLAVFAKNLITSFICVFEKVDENTRKSLFKLRSTWDEVFPLKKLYALDVRVNSVDPAWPIKPLPPPTSTAIHVNPRFLKQSEEPPSPQAAPVQPPALTPAPQPAPVIPQSSLTQEQLIRQQLLAKQKQLLELQQKKIELELEQTKAQLMGQAGFGLPPGSSVSAAASSSLSKPPTQTAPVIRPWIPPLPQSEPKPSTRDPRLNRVGPLTKEPPAAKRDSPVVPPDRKPVEKSSRQDKGRTPRKEVLDNQSKSPSPLTRSVQSKTKPAEPEAQKPADGTKKDPRLKKRPQDKTTESKEDEVKDKKRCGDKKERDESPRGPEPLRTTKIKVHNGSVVKHERDESSEKIDFKTGGNARTHARKRSRSPTASPKRKERRSPKSRARSSSPSLSHKPGKPRQHGKPGREDRVAQKKTQSEGRRLKRPAEDRRSESRDSHSPRGHDGGGKESKETPQRWRSGWEDSKHLKLLEDARSKPGPPRHKLYGTPTRPGTPRTLKHRLSVDPNLQIPEVLNSASKKDLLRRASKRLESGEISQEDFLNMAHQIKHLFQYQEEKQQRSDVWDQAQDFPLSKSSLLSMSPNTQPHPQKPMDAAELSYYEHKSKLKKTQVSHRVSAEDRQDVSEDSRDLGPGDNSRSAYSRLARDRTGERRSNEGEEPQPPLAPMIEEYHHGKEFPKLKSLPGLRFRRRADPRESRETSEREWTSPLMERQVYEEEQKSSYDAPRRYGPPTEPRRSEGPSPSGAGSRTCPSPGGLEAPPLRFERERLSPLHQKDSADLSPVPRFESPNSEHSDDGPLEVPHAPPPKASVKGPPRGGPLSSVRPHGDSPGHTPPHEGGQPPTRYSGPGPMGPSRPHRPGWYEAGGLGHYEEPQFEGPPHPGPCRFDGGAPHRDGEGPRMSHGPMKGDGLARFDGPPQGPVRFGAPIGQQTPVRYEGPVGGPGPLEGPVQHFEGPVCFNNMGPAPMGFQQQQQQQRPLRFEGPGNQMGPMRFDGPARFEGPGQLGPRFDMPSGAPRFDYPPGQQGPPRFAPQPNMQRPMQPMAPPMYDSPMVPQQNFNMAPQRFPEALNPQFPAGPSMQPVGSFNMQPSPFNQPGPGAFYSPAAPAVGLHQPVNLNQAFLPQNPVPFGPQTHPVAPPENHFGQVDVNDLLSKLISTGIIKPSSQPEATPTSSTESSSAAAPAPPPGEEEEEEEPEVEDEDLPDLTIFSIDLMKQRYESVVTKLYSGNQCCLCSMRFTTAQTDMYADHLDWHFRQNHAGKVASKKVTHRRWYYSLTDWIEFEEIADLEERAKSQFFEKENEEEVQKSQAAAKEKEFQSVRATKDQVGESCEICQESFETYWVEEEEDWFLKDAIRVDEKNFHPACFEDYKNTSSYLDVTPSPSKLLTEHPLGAFIKEEEEETSCDVTTVKQEVQSEVPLKEEAQDQEEVQVQEVLDSAQSEDKA